MIAWRGGVRAFGHPAHAFLVHVPLGLLPLAVPLDAAGWWLADPFWARAAFWAAGAGLAAAVPAAAAGLADLAALPRGHPAEETALRHMLVMAVALACFALGLALRGGVVPADPRRLLLATGANALGVVWLGVGGWLGGELVFRHRLGGVEPGEGARGG